ncbi:MULTISPECIES: hypothetical protein [unclassified Microcoleus]|uniref:hypothetical protein n=1 Tax=unclassified Microcoleus TaxID=2642155 RepID=UPI0025E26009|nr:MULTISPECIES: hypothetical protein [unclassified Microcoleus]
MSSQNILQQIKNSQSLLPASRDPPLHPTRSPSRCLANPLFLRLCDRLNKT